MAEMSMNRNGSDRSEVESGPEPYQSQILTFFDRIAVGLGFSVGPVRIVMSRDCQLKCAMLPSVQTTLSIKS